MMEDFTTSWEMDPYIPCNVEICSPELVCYIQIFKDAEGITREGNGSTLCS